MLELKNIKKDYAAGDGKVAALRGIDLKFRNSEFVSVLGPSGCGKTTMLNIIGGLDKYTSGDLVINGVSTKEYRDRDWDTYRNHNIGFVFQSYNLIPHQTVLQNVELALTLSGVSKKERRARAKEALREVGLGDQLRKKPSEMSGGQMQRVAIARALVNNPDIILADEPTGALDTETSVQVMEILKKVSENHLVIMVTHNPDLAEKYSTRIIRMLDGVITDDGGAPTEDEIKSAREYDSEKVKSEKSVKKPTMSFFTAFSLSLKNLFTKKGRTVLTSFAGSIGIIGIALIYAASHGMTGYIDILQEDTLSSYPITIQAQHIDISSLLSTFIGSAKSKEQHENDAVYEKSAVYELINAMSKLEAEENDLNAFKKYIESEMSDSGTNEELKKELNGVQYSYDLDLMVYTKDESGKIVRSDTKELLGKIMAEYFGMNMQETSKASSGGSVMSMMMGGGSGNYRSLWQEMLPGKNGEIVNNLLFKQYDVVYGSFPKAYNEIVIVLDKNNEIDDMTLYALGLKTEEEINDLMSAAMNGEEVENNAKKWTYEEICKREFRVVLNSGVYTLGPDGNYSSDLTRTDAGLKYLYDNAIPLKVSGIVKPSEKAVSSMLTGSIGYTSLLTEYVSQQTENAEAVKAQLENPSRDIFTGLPFKENTGNLKTNEKAEEFKKYTENLKDNEKADMYVKIMSVPTADEVKTSTDGIMATMTREKMNETLRGVLTGEMGVGEAEVDSYISSLSDEDITSMFREMAEEQVRAQYKKAVSEQLSAVPAPMLISMYDQLLPTLTEERMAELYGEVLDFSDSTLDNNLEKLGKIDLDTPSGINLYATTFSGKDIIEDMIKAYNEGKDDMEKISYTDYVGLMMSSITSIINAISYVLIGFVAVSLIVSSIMIGVITLISVQERTKEIGILRAIGASKKNVSSMFNAETVIIGFTSGIFGVGITYLLSIPLNLLIHSLTGIENLSLDLPVTTALILILISISLTLFSGIIPSRSASKKDPVVALRTE